MRRGATAVVEVVVVEEKCLVMLLLLLLVLKAMAFHMAATAAVAAVAVGGVEGGVGKGIIINSPEGLSMGRILVLVLLLLLLVILVLVVFFLSLKVISALQVWEAHRVGHARRRIASSCLRFGRRMGWS